MLMDFASANAQQVDQLPNSGSTIHVSVDRINVGVTVTDSHGRSVPGLRREDFRIFDNGVEQPISGFVPSEEPARLVFLIESSIADTLLAKLGKSPFLGADNLLNNISAIDRVAIVTFSNSPRLLLDFTPDKIQARRVLEEVNSQIVGLRSNTGSGLQNLSSSVAATIDWLAATPGSKIIVLLSTGIDTSPPESLLVFQEKVKTSDVRILALSMFGDFRKPAKHKKLSPDDRSDRIFLKQGITQSDALLRELSEATGGHAYFPKNSKDFDRAYGEIAQLVRSEYTLEFVPPAYDRQVHAIRVKVKHSWYHADYRPAYLAPASSAQ
jgi:Ca-activated chloride channel homolog